MGITARILAIALAGVILFGCVSIPFSDSVESCKNNGEKSYTCLSAANGSALRVEFNTMNFNCNESVDYQHSEAIVRSCPTSKEALLLLAAESAIEGSNASTPCVPLKCSVTDSSVQKNRVSLNLTCDEEVAKAGNFYGVEIRSAASFEYGKCRSFDPPFQNCTTNGGVQECRSVVTMAVTKR